MFNIVKNFTLLGILLTLYDKLSKPMHNLLYFMTIKKHKSKVYTKVIKMIKGVSIKIIGFSLNVCYNYNYLVSKTNSFFSPMSTDTYCSSQPTRLTIPNINKYWIAKSVSWKSFAINADATLTDAPICL